MDTSKVTRIEVIDHTFWIFYDKADIKNPKVEAVLQDEGRTLKVFISKK